MLIWSKGVLKERGQVHYTFFRHTTNDVTIRHYFVRPHIELWIGQFILNNGKSIQLTIVVSFTNILDTYLISFQQHSGYLLDFFSAIFWIPTWFLFTCETGELIFNKVSCKLVFFWDNLCLQNSLILGLCAKLAKNIENTVWLIIIYGNHLWSDNLLWTIPHSLLCCKVVIDKLYLRWTEGPLSKPNIFKVSA